MVASHHMIGTHITAVAVQRPVADQGAGKARHIDSSSAARHTWHGWPGVRIAVLQRVDVLHLVSRNGRIKQHRFVDIAHELSVTNCAGQCRSMVRVPSVLAGTDLEWYI